LEWLITNGRGSYGMGTVSGANTRRYHGLLAAAITPPTGRMVTVSKLEETVCAGGVTAELSTNQYPGALHPQGFKRLAAYLVDPVPTIVWEIGSNVYLQKRLWMCPGEDTAYAEYTLFGADTADLTIVPLTAWKDYHSQMKPWEGYPSRVEIGEDRIRLEPVEAAPTLTVQWRGCRAAALGYWHRNVEQPREQERGFDHHEDLFCPAQLTGTLQCEIPMVVTCSLLERPSDPFEALDLNLKRHRVVLPKLFAAPQRVEQLAACTADYLITRCEGGPQRDSVIAGFPWFTDWGRDTMISLTGLCTALGRTAFAADLLTDYGRFVRRGLIPNRFPDAGAEPEYNTADATLWYVHALGELISADSGVGLQTAEALWPVLMEILDAHRSGTDHGIAIDPRDGLLRAGEPGVQLTWMDAKVGDWVVTPRIGKPVELNALWRNLLSVLRSTARRLGRRVPISAEETEEFDRQFRRAFVRQDGEGLYDVVGDNFQDAAIRPNQIFAVSLQGSLLTRAQQRRVVDTVAEHLLTPVGLRSLSPADACYRGRYEGSPLERDSAYHQGTVWGWLLGPYVLAHHAVYRRPEEGLALLEAQLEACSGEGCLGHIPEIFDGDAPHHPNGCPAQAWSVAETLRAWLRLRSAMKSNVGLDRLAV
jgi:predicted glycogen debranching enzyme